MTIDKRITFALLVTIVIETGGGLIWAGRAAARLEAVESQIVVQRPLAERLARLETRIDDLKGQLDRIETAVDADGRHR